MTEHYFSQQPQSISSPRTWSYQLKGKQYTFTSDIGVFSKNEVDFGSQLLIEHFKAPEAAGDLLDLGCGYGPIGIVMANQHKDRKVVMADINERAVELAAKNACRNHADNVECIQSDCFSEVKDHAIAAVLTNPPIRAGKRVVHKMFEESKAALNKGGELWVVIQKKQGAPSARKKLEELFAVVEVVARKKGYFILRAINS